MRIWLVVLLAACWTSNKPEPARPITESAPPPGAAVSRSRPPPDERDRVLLAMSGFRDQMCSCRDRGCADHVQEDMTRWAQDMATRMHDDRPAKLDEDQVKQMTEVTEQYAKCMMAAMGVGGGGNPCAGP